MIFWDIKVSLGLLLWAVALVAVVAIATAVHLKVRDADHTMASNVFFGLFGVLISRMKLFCLAFWGLFVIWNILEESDIGKFW